MNYGDLLIWWVDHHAGLAPITHLIIDEMQDCDPIQNHLIEMYRKSGASITVVGDDAQSIYGFRGASVHFLRDFHKVTQQSHTSLLVRNYRSTAPIVALCNHIIQWHGDCIKKELVSQVEAPTMYNTNPEAWLFTSFYNQGARRTGTSMHRGVAERASLRGVVASKRRV